jgi:hypothetical protein
MKRSILVSGLLLITLSGFSASVGISVGADLLFGNVAAKIISFRVKHIRSLRCSPDQRQYGPPSSTIKPVILLSGSARI